MKRVYCRSGSALLIVLGMLSFMVVSAVGFSIFMRESRKPSSHLRRNITARLLLRAALANAISRIDGELVELKDKKGKARNFVEGVYDDPYPGLGSSSSLRDEENGDLWAGRIFMPFGQVDPSNTVSTLTLESLAYLPPAIINDVRAGARLTRTAAWKNLAYDLGRYAFCAVDVSDCFDINKVRANERRTSAANQRVNLSPLYPDLGADLDNELNKVLNGRPPPSFISLADYNIVVGKGSKFAPWMNAIDTEDNLFYEAGDKDYVANALFITDTWFPPTNTVVAAEGSNSAGTTGKGAKATRTYNLATDQPWDDNGFQSKSIEAAVQKVNIKGKTEGVGAPLANLLEGVGLACLYDYLDEDQVPISYCFPCTETAPMICALGIRPLVKMAFKNDTKNPVAEGQSVYDKETKSYKYKVKVTRCSLEVTASRLSANGVLAFPFKRADTDKAHGKFSKYGSDYQRNFECDALFRVFFGVEQMNCRLKYDDKKSIKNENMSVHPRNESTRWSGLPTGAKNGVFTAYAPTSKFNVESGFATRFVMSGDPSKMQERALGDFSIAASGQDEFTLFYRVEVTDAASGEVVDAWCSFDGVKKSGKAFCPRDADGVCETEWVNALNDKDEPKSPSDGIYPDNRDAEPWPSGRTGSPLDKLRELKVFPHVAVWVRVFDKGGEQSGDTYDVVPAHPDDDKLFGKRAKYGGDWIRFAGGNDRAPILEFCDGNEVAFDYDTLAAAFPAAGKSLTFDRRWNRLYAVDPRYNFAPENWFAVKEADGNVTKQQWLEAITPLLGDDGRDRDIFMFTSDQEYLQSVGELAFLPRVGDGRGLTQIFDYYDSESKFLKALKAKPFFPTRTIDPHELDPEIDHKEVGEILGSLGQAEFYWRTYSGFDNGDGIDGLYSIAAGNESCEIVSSVNDFRANPFSQDERILAAVVRDTPFDYYAASTNDLNALYDKEIDKQTAEDAREYRNVFTDDTKKSSSRGYVRGFSDLAGALRKAMANVAMNAGQGWRDWRDIYDNLKWASDEVGDEQTDIFGLPNIFDSPLHGVDRKFLYAYWRECFQNRQQLFLVFLRAEPLTVGGMGFGSLAAAQLGARGVALVWRDPVPPPPVHGSVKREDRREYQNDDGLAKWRDMLKSSGPHRTRVLFYHPID